LALSHARGVWVAQLDADDSYEPERLARLLALGEAQQADIVSDNVLMCPDDGSASPSPMIPQNIWPTARLLTAAEFVAGNIGDRRNPRMSLGFMMPIFRRAFLERNKLRYDERNRFGEDFMLYLACLVHGARWWVEPAAMYRYTIRNGSLTEVQTAADLQRIRTFEQDLLRDCPLAHSNPAFAHALRRHKSKIDRCYYYRAFTDAVKARQITHARRVLFESPSGFRHIMQESLAQMPVITAKALRGGYRAKPSSRRAISG
jgi:succinoglycan biosynthesis protein ExoO/succinoglycan biosynthesis protein ExoU